MDGRWSAPNVDRKMDRRIILHPIATINEVRTGIYLSPDDSVDLTDYVSSGTQSQFDCTVTLDWKDELFGDGQPRNNQVLEIQLYDNGGFQTVWIGLISAISSYTMSRGKRSMQLIARTRDSKPAWRTTKRVTPLYPQLTDMAYIIRRIARTVGMEPDEIAIPMSAYQTPHSNTQLADMTAWEMITAIMLPMGLTPWIDGTGRLRGADRNLQGRTPDIVYVDQEVEKANGSNSIAPVTRVRVAWLDPHLTRSLQQGRKLADVTMTTGWFLPFIRKETYWSEDRTQRATDTYMRIIHSANLIRFFCNEEYVQTGENRGRITVTNYLFAPMLAAITTWALAHNIQDEVVITGPGVGVTVPTGRRTEAIAQVAFTLMLMCIGTGIYEIWGTPFEWVHARNITDAFNDQEPLQDADNPKEIETDFVLDEGHAQSIAIRELIYGVREASKWTVSTVDDPRVEFGDIIELPDGSRLYVEDFSRPLGRDQEGIMQIEGFLV